MKPRKLLLATALFSSVLATTASAQLVSTLAGTGMGMFNAGFTGDGGRATVATLNVPFDVAVRANGDLYFTDKLNNRIRKISAAGIITTIAGTGTAGNTGDGGPAAAAAIDNPTAIAIDAAGNIFFVSGRNRVRMINPAGNISTWAGTGVTGFSGDGSGASNATFNSIEDLAFAANGDLLLADAGNHRIRKVSTFGVVTTVAGNGTAAFAGDGGPALSASFKFPSSIAVASNGDYYIADGGNKRIRMVSAAGTVSTVAGNGGNVFQDGAAMSVGLRGPSDLALAPNGTLYFADQPAPNPGSNLRSLSGGNVSTVMSGMGFGGQGQGGYTATAQINTLRGIFVDGSNNAYLADPDDSRIVMICNNPVLAPDSARYLRSGVADNMANPFIAMERCKLISRFENTGQAIATDLEYKVRVAAATHAYQGRPFVRRGFDLMTAASTNLSGRFTMYFSQADFNAYNSASAASGYEKLPTGPADAAGIQHVTVMHYGGTGTAPGNYSGSSTVLTPSAMTVTYNALNDRWEVSLPITATGGYYITSMPTLSVPGEGAAPAPLRLWPVETSGMLYVEAQQATRALVLDAVGRRLMIFDLEPGRQTVDVSALPAGVYYLRTAQGAAFRIVRL